MRCSPIPDITVWGIKVQPSGQGDKKMRKRTLGMVTGICVILAITFVFTGASFAKERIVFGGGPAGGIRRQWCGGHGKRRRAIA